MRRQSDANAGLPAPLQPPTGDADGGQTESSDSLLPLRSSGVGGDSSGRGRGEAGPVVAAAVAGRHQPCGSLKKTVNLH